MSFGRRRPATREKGQFSLGEPLAQFGVTRVHGDGVVRDEGGADSCTDVAPRDGYLKIGSVLHRLLAVGTLRRRHPSILRVAQWSPLDPVWNV